MFYIPNRNRVRQLKKAVFFHQSSGITTKFWQRYRNKSLQRNKKVQNQGLSSLPLKYACLLLSKMLHRLAKNGHASRARASGVFRFLPSPFTSMSYLLIYNELQVKAKTIFAFTPCDLPFLTRRGREIPHENAEKAVDFEQKRANLRAKTHNNPSDSRTAVKAKVNTDLHLCLHHINLIYCVLHKQVKGEGKKRKCGVRTRSRARGNVRFDNTRQSFREILLSGKSLDAANLSF